MTQLSIKLQKIFADLGTSYYDSRYLITQFGSLKANAPLATNNPTTIQALTAYDSGFYASLINGAPPAIQDMNALCYLITRDLAYLQQVGIPEYDATTVYEYGSFCSYGRGIYMYVAAAGNYGNSPINVAYWMVINNEVVRVVASLTTGDTILYSDVHVVLYVNANSLTPTITMPTPSALNKGRVLYLTIVPNGYITTVTFSGTVDGVSNKTLSNAATSAYTIRPMFISNGSTWDLHHEEQEQSM